jgi:hypothetical protein
MSGKACCRHPPNIQFDSNSICLCLNSTLCLVLLLSLSANHYTLAWPTPETLPSTPHRIHQNNHHGLRHFLGLRHAQSAHVSIHTTGRQRDAHLDRGHSRPLIGTWRPPGCIAGWRRIVRVGESHITASWCQVQEEPDAVYSDGEHQSIFESMRDAAAEHAITRPLLDRRPVRRKGPSTSSAVYWGLFTTGACRQSIDIQVNNRAQETGHPTHAVWNRIDIIERIWINETERIWPVEQSHKDLSLSRYALIRSRNVTCLNWRLE